MAIRAIIFDLGGVIVRTEDQGPRERLAQRLGLPVGELYRLIFENESAAEATVGRITSSAHWESVRAALQLNQEDFSSLPEEFFAGDQVDYQLVDLLRRLRSDYKTALLSNAWDDLRQIMARKWLIADEFDEIIVSAEVHLAKPDPRIYLLAVERLGVEPGQAVFVDDVEINIQGAQAAGLLGIHFHSPQQALEELKEILNGRI